MREPRMGPQMQGKDPEYCRPADTGRFGVLEHNADTEAGNRRINKAKRYNVVIKVKTKKGESTTVIPRTPESDIAHVRTTLQSADPCSLHPAHSVLETQ